MVEVLLPVVGAGAFDKVPLRRDFPELMLVQFHFRRILSRETPLCDTSSLAPAVRLAPSMGLLFDFAEPKALDLDTGSKRSISRNVANSPMLYSGSFTSKVNALGSAAAHTHSLVCPL